MKGSATAKVCYVDDETEGFCPSKPERNLLAAVMARAICDAFGSAQCERHVVRSARQWIFAPLAPKEPFSFAWVATNLDLDPEDLQKSMRTYDRGQPEELSAALACLR